MPNKFIYWLISILTALAFNVMAQENPRRSEIDEARGSLWFFDKQALEKSREFIKKDTSYYVGHLYEGAYKYYRAADKQGFNLALVPLLHAYKQIVRDYKSKLKLRTSDVFRYMDTYKYHQDFGMLTYMITQCYENMDQPDKAVEYCKKYKSYNIQMEFYFNPYTTLSWIYHRNRIYDNKRFSFLEADIQGNEQKSMKFLDSAKVKFYRDLPVNASFFGLAQLEQELLNIYHYKTILFSYNYQIDSAEYYFDKLLDQPAHYPPYNNYGHLKITKGDFASANEYFIKASKQSMPGKQTREQFYMLSMLDVYKNTSSESVKKLKEIIKAQGSSPGFGWHNIALARNYHYLGLTEQSEKAAKKAENFEEMYIGTTWLPEQYKSATAVMQYMNKSQEMARIKFENKGWWYNPSDLFRLSKLWIESFWMKFDLANVFSQSHEREQVTYHILSSENLVTFDEVWFLIKDFSPNFFTKKFSSLMQTDKRPNLKRYYRFYLAKILQEEGSYQAAKDSFNLILTERYLDKSNEKLLVARTYESLANIAIEQDSLDAAKKYTQKLYETYPELLPYSGLKLEMNLILPAVLSPKQQEVIESLKKSQINWTTQIDSQLPTLRVTFGKSGKNEEVNFEVNNSEGTSLQKGSFILEQTKDAGKFVAFAAFGVKRFEIIE